MLQGAQGQLGERGLVRQRLALRRPDPAINGATDGGRIGAAAGQGLSSSLLRLPGQPEQQVLGAQVGGAPGPGGLAGERDRLLLTAILHLIQDDEEPYQLVRQLVGALAPGSYVVISHAAADIGNGDMASMTSRLNELMAQQTTPRNRAQVSQFFEGLDLVEPDLVRVPEWRPAMAIDAKAPGQMWAGVALKPAAEPSVKPALEP